MTDQASEQDRRIIVGVDSSPGSTAALRWAMIQARLTGGQVEAISTWQNPAVYGYPYGWVPDTSGAELAAINARILDETVAVVAADLDQPVEVRTRVVEGHPAQVLTDAAAGAALLVVGSRGHGTFTGMLLGSVSQHCVQHAHCPVVVVPR